MRRTIAVAAVLVFCSLPVLARDSGFTSTCNVSCLVTSCSISCTAGKGGGAVCTCAWGLASCACGGGGSPSIAFSPAASFDTSGSTFTWREAGPQATPPSGRGVAKQPVLARSTVFVPTEEEKGQLADLQKLFRAFGTPAASRALESAGNVHKGIVAGDTAAYTRAIQDYTSAIGALSPDQRSAVEAFIEAFQACSPQVPAASTRAAAPVQP